MHDRKIISSKAAIPVLANPSIAQPNGHITTTHLALDMTLAHFQIPIELRIIIKFYFHQAIEKMKTSMSPSDVGWYLEASQSLGTDQFLIGTLKE